MRGRRTTNTTPSRNRKNCVERISTTDERQKPAIVKDDDLTPAKVIASTLGQEESDEQSVELQTDKEHLVLIVVIDRIG